MVTKLAENHLDNYSLQWRDALARVIAERKIGEIFVKIRESHVEPILIKGWTIARFYPPEQKRDIGDFDFCVASNNYSRVKKLLRTSLFDDFSRAEIDLHDGFKHLDKLSFEELFQRSETIELHGVSVRILSQEDNLRVTCVHWLIDSGTHRHKLWDIYYLVKNRQIDFDWDWCLNANGKIRRRWVICAIALAHRILNLNVDDLPFADEIKNPDVLPVWLMPALEKEWNDEVKLGDLLTTLNDWRAFRAQIIKRFPPNPIGASIDTEAPFDDSARLPYQIKDVFVRLYWTSKREIEKFYYR